MMNHSQIKTNERGRPCAAAALLELAIAYGFIFASDWAKYAQEARERQNAR